MKSIVLKFRHYNTPDLVVTEDEFGELSAEEMLEELVQAINYGKDRVFLFPNSTFFVRTFDILGGEIIEENSHSVSER